MRVRVPDLFYYAFVDNDHMFDYYIISRSGIARLVLGRPPLSCPFTYSIPELWTGNRTGLLPGLMPDGSPVLFAFSALLAVGAATDEDECACPDEEDGSACCNWQPRGGTGLRQAPLRRGCGCGSVEGLECLVGVHPVLLVESAGLDGVTAPVVRVEVPLLVTGSFIEHVLAVGALGDPDVVLVKVRGQLVARVADGQGLSDSILDPVGVASSAGLWFWFDPACLLGVVAVAGTGLDCRWVDVPRCRVLGWLRPTPSPRHRDQHRTVAR